jgi:hypothetical protein
MGEVLLRDPSFNSRLIKNLKLKDAVLKRIGRDKK